MERFEGLVERWKSGVVVAVPLDVKAVFGSGRPPVRVRIRGYEFRTTLAPMGGRHLLGLNREVRERTGVEAGDHVAVELELDTEPRTVEVPPDLAEALAGEPELREFFDGLSFTHRREYAEWIEGAKRQGTRGRRVERALELLRAGVRTPG